MVTSGSSFSTPTVSATTNGDDEDLTFVTFAPVPDDFATEDAAATDVNSTPTRPTLTQTSAARTALLRLTRTSQSSLPQQCLADILEASRPPLRLAEKLPWYGRPVK